MQKITWIEASFDRLSTTQLYDILSLRAEVFVVEQGQPYQDVDYRDKICTHVMGYCGSNIVAHCRVFPVGGYFDDGCIGRVVVKPNQRGTGLGHELIEKGIATHNRINGTDKSITISAQLRLRHFYEMHGFIKSSTCYQEDNIPHIHMTRAAEKL
ncbi:MAG: GNAT family N-acetyltransferase [Muribaculaceae bacterium]|nr:GNAT family N-acetyltransferase [Muribaculaceae bacterium]